MLEQDGGDVEPLQSLRQGSEPPWRHEQESGFVDLAAATYACNSTGSITLIATVAQGTSVNQRVGKKIQWKSMQIRGTVQANATTVSNNSAWLIVYDRRPTGSLPAITDVLSSATAISFTNDANSGRFQILKRWNDTILGNVGTAGQQTDKSSVVVDEFLSLRSCLAPTRLLAPARSATSNKAPST